MLKLKSLLAELLATQKKLDVAIELLPNMPQSTQLLAARKNVRDHFNKNIVVKWERMAGMLGIDADMKKGIGYLNNFESNQVVNVLANSLYKAALDCLKKELRLVEVAQKLTGNMKNVLRRKQIAGFLDWFSGDPKVSDMERGRIAFGFYYNRAKTYESTLPNTFEEFIFEITKKSPELVDGLGGTINSIDQDIGYSNDQVQAVMEKLADSGGGKLPANFGTFQMAVGKNAADPSFWTSLKFTTVESTSQIVESVATGFQDVGQGLLSTLNLSTKLLKYLPFVLVGVSAVAVYYYAPKKRWD